MDICSLILSLSIVGAYEFSPNNMMVQYWEPVTNTFEEIVVYTDDYIECLERPVPLRETGGADSGGGGTTSDS